MFYENYFPMHFREVYIGKGKYRPKDGILRNICHTALTALCTCLSIHGYVTKYYLLYQSIVIHRSILLPLKLDVSESLPREEGGNRQVDGRSPANHLNFR